MRLRLYSLLGVLALVVMMGAAAPASVAAQEPVATPEAGPELPSLPRFVISAVGDHEHQWFDITVEAGETMALTAAIRNVGDVDTTLYTYVANASNPPNGGFSAGTNEEDLVGATLWLDYPGATFDTRPGEAREVDFTVSVPSETAPGVYVAALVAQTADPVGIPGSNVFEQVIRSTISVEITVPGEMTSGLELGDPVASPAGAQWTLDVPISNTGTARLRPQGDLIVTTSAGEETITSSIEMGSIYGGNTTGVRIALPEQLSPGDYFVSMNLHDPATGVSDALFNAPFAIAAPPEVPDAPPVFSVDDVSVIPNGDPVRYVDVSATITNNGQTIPTANVTLTVRRDGEDVERYPLAKNQALVHGSTDFKQRYIPIDDWQPGTWSFQLEVSSVNGGTETMLATVDVPDQITVP